MWQGLKYASVLKNKANDTTSYHHYSNTCFSIYFDKHCSHQAAYNEVKKHLLLEIALICRVIKAIIYLSKVL